MPGRKVSGDRTSSLCQVGKTQAPVTALISDPVETVCPEFGGSPRFGPSSTAKLYRGELGGPGTRQAQSLAPPEAKHHSSAPNLDLC